MSTSGDRTDLIDAWLDGELSDVGELQAWLCAEAGRLESFVESSLLHRALREAILTQQSAVSSEQSAVGSGQWAVCDDPPSALRPPPSSNPQSLIPNPSPVPFIVVDHTLPSPLSPLPSFLFSYTVAAIIFGIAGLCGWLYQVEHYTEFARQFGASPAAVEQPKSPAAEEMTRVARVTGLVDCQWSEPETEAFNGSHISKGRRFALASGLLQLTYDSGAKVILQGPCTYEVESPAGGFLSLGKLTAKVASGQWPVASAKPQAANPKSRNPQIPKSPNPLFTVKTPTAVVTDLGTEFGVEVCQSGTTAAHVFHGVVELQVAAADGRPGKAVRLTENQSAQVDKPSGGEDVTLHRIAADPAAFVRADDVRRLAEEARLKDFRRWQTNSQQLRRDPSLLAYYDFQQKEGQPSVLLNVAGDGDGSLDGVVENATWTIGRMPGKHALLFQSPNDYVSVNLPQKTDDLTLAAWICIDSLDEQPLSGLLMSTGWMKPVQVHWQLTKAGALGFASTSIDGNHNSGPVIGSDRLRRWLHIASVYDHAAARVRFYVDGRGVSEAESQSSGPISIGPAWIGHWNPDDYPDTEPRNFRGRIDELAIFDRPLDADDIRRLYDGETVAESKP